VVKIDYEFFKEFEELKQRVEELEEKLFTQEYSEKEDINSEVDEELTSDIL
jgi:hypothetical protein